MDACPVLRGRAAQCRAGTCGADLSRKLVSNKIDETPSARYDPVGSVPRAIGNVPPEFAPEKS